MPIKDTFPKNVKKLIRTNSLYIEYTFLDQIFKNSGKKLNFFDFKEKNCQILINSGANSNSRINYNNMISWKEEDIMSINIDELKKKLKRNPVFNMSLSGKEIFHSNVLAWLLLETDDNDEATSTAKALTKLFPPKGLKADEKAEEKYRVLTVFREKMILIC